MIYPNLWELNHPYSDLAVCDMSQEMNPQTNLCGRTNSISHGIMGRVSKCQTSDFLFHSEYENHIRNALKMASSQNIFITNILIKVKSEFCS